MHPNLMTKAQFISYAQEVLFGEALECLYEQIAECQGEIAMFGDSGPGSMLRLRENIADYNSIADRYEKLTGSVVRSRPRMPYYPKTFADFQEEEREAAYF